MKEQPIEEHVRQTMQDIGGLLDRAFNMELRGDKRKWGFALLVFRFGEGEDHRSNYISNANRKDMIAVLKEFIANAEADEDHGDAA